MKLLITIMAVTALVGVSVFSVPALAQSTSSLNFDKDACYARCACTFGTFTACATCKAECDRRYWRAWDKQMGELSSTDKPSRKSR
ncbi:MAG: hypothetical protein RDU20_03535 [Desulfomonilaceae bacterium]|nr:hypothetical protein [Desulfomonilaceae bacterium]